MPLAGVVVGRKYSFEHARRAFCCRLPFLQTHPALMGTSVPCDVGVFVDGQRADFVGNKCHAWNAAENDFETIDGTTGRLDDGAPSSLCRRALFELFKRLANANSTPVPDTYALAKLESSDDDRKRADFMLRLAPNAPFQAWLSSRGVHIADASAPPPAGARQETSLAG